MFKSVFLLAPTPSYELQPFVNVMNHEPHQALLRSRQCFNPIHHFPCSQVRFKQLVRLEPVPETLPPLLIYLG